MALPTNDDFANCELSIEELEAIAAGWPSWVHKIEHAVEHGLEIAAKVAVGAGLVAFVAFTGYAVAYTARNYNQPQ
jgi:hypothetical protein